MTSFWTSAGLQDASSCLTNLGTPTQCPTKDLDSPNGGLMVIYYGRIRKTSPKKLTKEYILGKFGSVSHPQHQVCLQSASLDMFEMIDSQEFEFLHVALNNFAWKTLGDGHT